MTQNNRRLTNFTPLRYPGGKGRLAGYLKVLLKANRLFDGAYIEPYAGGAAIAMELLLHDYVSEVHINDISRPVYSFWRSVLEQTDKLSALISDTPLTVEEWDRQKAIFAAGTGDDLALGFAFFFLNRTNRSGILNGGIIGGRNQTGPWKIDARYNAEELVSRVQQIARLAGRINLTNQDAVRFLRNGTKKWPSNSLIYCDPPYYVKGRDLYYDFYEHADHINVASTVKAITRQHWMVSYDNVDAIRDMYSDCSGVAYDIGYSARTATWGSEVMFFSGSLEIPPLVGAVQETERFVVAA